MSSNWEPVPFRMRMCLQRRARHPGLFSEGIICQGFHISGTDIDGPRLNRAFELAIRRHPALRTRFRVDPTLGPQQQIGSTWPDVLSVVPVDGGVEAILARARDHMAGDGATVFDLTIGRLVRASLFTDGAVEHVLVVTVDHTSCDGISFARFMGDVNAAYEDPAAGEACEEPDYTLVDYAHAEAAYLEGPEGHRLRQAWTERLGNRVPEMMLVERRPWEHSLDGERSGISVATKEYLEIRRAAASLNATPAMLVVAALLDAMRPCIVSDRWSFVAPLAGRIPNSPDDLVGNLANLVPVTIGQTEPTDTAKLVLAVREGVLWALRHQALPFEHLVPHMDPAASPVLSRYRQIFISGLHRKPLVISGIVARQLTSTRAYPMFDLSVQIMASDAELTLQAIYRRDLLNRPLVLAWLGQMAASGRLGRANSGTEATV